jgi:predicted ATPase/DNA-binding NarL/FixJ family response regulator
MAQLAARSNLGGEPNAFIGRERELTELIELARASRALTLCGAGGIGKTRLAGRMLARLAADYPDGVWFVEFADLRQPDLVESRIASVMGVTEEPGRPLIETLADVLRPRRVLLALDNCEHLIDSCARVCQRLLASSEGLRVIATSREPLRVAAETVWQVPPLHLPPARAASDELLSSDAIRLFADRAAAARPGYAVGMDGGLELVASVCRVLDGLPLAIELAAAWVRVLTVEQIAARLDGQFRLLRSDERAGPARHRTLRAAIDWSYELLTPGEQILLRRLSALAGFALDMAEQACSGEDLPAGQVLDLLTSLADKSLVVVDPDPSGQFRYRMLDTVRAYAAARLAEAGETTMMAHRLRDYALSEVERSHSIGMAMTAAPWAARVETFRRFEAEQPNLRQVLGRCVAERDAQTGMRICASMRPVWIVQGSFAEGAEWFDAFLRMDVDVPPVVRGAALVGRAQLALATDRDDARQRARAALALCREAGPGGEIAHGGQGGQRSFWLGAALNLVAEIELHGQRLDEAEAAAREAEAASRAAGDRWNTGYALGTRAAVAGLRGDLAGARSLGEAALAVMREIDQQWGAARTLLGLADLARLTGDLAAARRCYLEALGVLRQLSARPEIARCLAGLGRMAIDTGDLPLARQQLAESIELSQFTGSRIGVIRALGAFAVLAGAEGDAARAVKLAAAADALRAAAHLPPAPARTQRVLDAAASLGDDAVKSLLDAGAGLSSAEAVALALAPAWPPAGRAHPAGTADQAGKADTAGGAQPARLTPRELQIADLIATAGRTRDIAAELFITEATVARHIANIMAKLGLRTRAQIAAWARQRQLP